MDYKNNKAIIPRKHFNLMLMKSLYRINQQTLRTTAVLLIALLSIISVNAQAIDCTSGTVMYGVFTNLNGSAFNDSTEFRAINYATGAVGPLMGNRKYHIFRTIGGTNFYGASAMGVDCLTGRFYVNTQMPSGGGLKDIITVNPVTGTMTTIATMASTLNGYHFVKMAISPSGVGYAIGVHRDSTTAASTCNPLIRFSTCGATPTAGCATASIVTLGYLPSTGLMYKWMLFNGDIAFDAVGNLYFATAAFARVNGIGRYTDSRLFKINASDIPAIAGTGTIPMSLVAEYDILDSTVVNGVAFDPAGTMYFSTRRFLGVQTSPAGPSVSEVYRNSGTLGSATNIATFGPVTANFSLGDLGSGFFPTGTLDANFAKLNGKYVAGASNLHWSVMNNTVVQYFEIQISNDGENFETIAKVNPINPTQSTMQYSYNDANTATGRKFYRVREVMSSGVRYYSNVITLNVNSRIAFNTKPKPNPFISNLELDIHLESNSNVIINLFDQSGRVVKEQRFSGTRGDNTVTLSNLSTLAKGIYTVELKVDGQVLREKLVKQ